MNGKLVTPFRIIENETIVIADGKIVDITSMAEKTPDLDTEYINADGCYVSPGFIDIHVHGGGGGDVYNDPKK
jgi:N-acetylglucosamine-6-phosphate deacetylase